MWKNFLKYRTQENNVQLMKVRSGAQTSFRHDNWSSLGRLHEILGDRGFIILGIKHEATVADAVKLYRRRNHLSDFLNRIETKLDK